jgi:prophage antirepressor-like protein
MILPLHYEGQAMRTATTEDGALWFCLPDVGRALGLSRPSHFLQSPQCIQKGVTKFVTPSAKGPQETTFISEPNLYLMIGRSNKPAAIAFSQWVASEVLPAIRKTGMYGMDDPEMEQLFARVATLESAAARAPAPDTLDEYGIGEWMAERTYEDRVETRYGVLLADYMAWANKRGIRTSSKIFKPEFAYRCGLAGIRLTADAAGTWATLSLHRPAPLPRG